MQISNQQVDIVQRSARAKDATAEAPVKSVEELAARHGVNMNEVRKFTERAMMAEEDPAREKRIRELTRKINAGSYQIDAEDLVDMAERRAIADRAKDI